MDGDRFEATIVRSGSAAVVECAGSIEKADRDQLWAALHDAILVSPHVVVDLSAVSFLDRTALNELLHATRLLARMGGGKLGLRGVPRPVARVLDVTGTVGDFRLLP